MHVIITMAGHSRRFKEVGFGVPKFLIPIDGEPMIEHVVNMFNSNDNFYFVLNKEQVNQNTSLVKQLKLLARIVEIVIIDPHEIGPVHSALQVNIPDDEPVIVSYCDFLVRWNYSSFLRVIGDYDGAVPSFRGFHPASFGHTHYAYMRVNEHGEMIELREKNSFTSERHNEFASTGIYYFRRWDLYKHYARELLKEGFQGLQEGYVSLIYNLMVRDKCSIKITEVDNFICWGTPEDLEQYQFWQHYFRTKHSAATQLNGSKTREQINLIPMGGKGSRFKSYGYRTSKPLIQIRNKPMIVAACNSFPEATKWIFLPREEDLLKHPIEKTLKRFNQCSKVIPVKEETSGQAATCLLAKDEFCDEESLFIASCDYETIYSKQKWEEILADKTIDGAIWTCRLGANLVKNPKAFAYCSTKSADSSEIKKIVEKDTISDKPWNDPLVVGSFWFRRAKDFVFAAEQSINENLTVNGEHYVANSINLLIEKGKRFVIFDIEQWVSFGDPFELQLYHYWESFFSEYKVSESCLSEPEVA